MDHLKHSWITDHLVDFEYKKYILLAYLKNVKKKFHEHKLYPQLSDLILHYNNLIKLKQNKELLFENFPQTPTGMEIKKLKVTYRKLVKDDELMDQLSEIISYALPEIDGTIQQGQEIYEFLETQLELDTVGLMPIYNGEGYMLLNEDTQKELLIYRYKVSFFENNDEQYRAINTTYVTQEVKSITRTFQQIKLDLIKQYSELPNPATFVFTSKFQLPITETFLPMAKRLLMRNVAFNLA